MNITKVVPKFRSYPLLGYVRKPCTDPPLSPPCAEYEMKVPRCGNVLGRLFVTPSPEPRSGFSERESRNDRERYRDYKLRRVFHGLAVRRLITLLLFPSFCLTIKMSRIAQGNSSSLIVLCNLLFQRRTRELNKITFRVTIRRCTDVISSPRKRSS